MTGSDWILTLLGWALVGSGIAALFMLIRRAFMTQESIERPFLLLEAIGILLLVVNSLEAIGQDIASSWLSAPLRGFAAAIAWVYRLVPLSVLASVAFLLLVIGVGGLRARR